MNDVRTLLERGYADATPPPDGFERMLRRRDRKRRSQRIAAGVVGIAVFVAAVWIVTTAGSFHNAQTPAVPGASPSPPPDVDLQELERTVGGVTFSFNVPITHRVFESSWEPKAAISINKSIVGPQGAEAMFFWTSFPDDKRTDPCARLLPSATDLAAAVASAPGTELVEGPSDVTVGGYPAKHVVLTVREDLGCDPGFFYTWHDPMGGALFTGTTVGDTIRVWIVDVDGTRLFLEAVTTEQADFDLEREIEQIVESIRFESAAPDPDAEVLNGLPLEGATPSTPESGELVVELANQVWVYADGRVISSVYDYTLEPYSGLVEQHLTPEGVEFLRSNVLSTGLFEDDLELAREDNPSCCLDIRVRDGDRLVSVRLGPRYALSDHQAPIATPEQATALQSLYALLTSPTSWPASVWTDQRIRAYVPTSYSFCSRFAEPTRVLALLPEPARDLLGAGYLKADGDGTPQPTCSRMTTEEARALAGILAAEFGHQYGSLGFSFEDPEVLGSSIRIAMNPVLPHGAWAWLAGVG